MTTDVRHTRSVVPRWKIALVAYICVVVTLCISFVALILGGWRPESPRQTPSLGASAQQCEETFGHPFDTGYNMEDLHRWSEGFYKGGWSMIISFDGRRRAEQFIFCKTQLPNLRPPTMNDAEQKALLEKFKEGSTWTLSQKEARGSLWDREDGQAAAFYVEDSRWLIFMNKAGWERFARSVGLPTK